MGGVASIDHVARAQTLVSEARGEESAGGTVRASRRLAEAQVHATLAVAEQLKIANLLALASHRVAGADGSIVETTVEGAIAMRHEASVLLGVNEDGTLS